MSVVLGLPKKLLPSPEASLSEGCKSQFVKIQPNNVSSVISNGFSLGASVTNSQMPMQSQEIRFSIPTGQGKNVWLDTSKTTLSFRARYQVSVAGTGSVISSASLISNCLSFFDRIQVLNSNGVAVEDVTGLGLAEHQKQSYSFVAAERDSLALMYGYKFESATGLAANNDSRNILQGHPIPAFTNGTAAALAAASNFFSYEVPLPSSFLGAGAKGFVPIGALQKLDCYLTTASTLPIIVTTDAGMTGAATLVVTLDNFAINASYLTLDDRSSALLGSNKMHYVHGITQKVSNATINSGINGSISTLIGIRGQSVRALATRFSESAYTTAGSVNGVFDSKMPLASQLNYFLAGKDRVPPNPHSTNQAPATVFSRAVQASEAFTEKAMKFAGTPDAYCVFTATGTAPTSANGFDQYIISAGSSTSVATLSTFSFAEDLRKASTSAILDGYNLSQSANNFLEINITNAPTNSLYVSFIASMDVIYMIDMELGTVDFRI